MMYRRTARKRPNGKATREWMTAWADLTLAGVPTLDALDLSLDMIPAGSKTQALRLRLIRAKQYMESGQTLITSFRAAFNRLPQPLELALVCAQASGDLGEALQTQLKRWEQQDQDRQTLLKSLAYPVAVLALSIACWVFLSHMTRSTTTPHSTGAQPTDLASWLITCGGLLLVTALIGKHKQSGQATAWWQRFPSAYGATSDFYHVIACELKAGYDLMHCLRHQPVSHSFLPGLKTPSQLAVTRLNRTANELQHKLQAGQPLSTALEQAKAPAFLIRQARLAEHTGNLDHCFEVAAKVYGLRAKQAQRRLEALLAPITLASAAIILTGAYQSTLAPLYQNLGGFQ